MGKSGVYETREAQSGFTNGDGVFMRNWPFAYALFFDPEQSRVRPERVGTSTIPVSREGNESFSGLGGWNFLVNAGSEDKMDRIWPSIWSMSVPEKHKLWTISGSFLPALKDLYDDGEVL